MRQLIKWIGLGVFGYLLYEVVGRLKPRTGMLGGRPPAAAPRRESTGNITGYSGKGTFVPVMETDGAERTARVGRGVI